MAVTGYLYEALRAHRQRTIDALPVCTADNPLPNREARHPDMLVTEYVDGDGCVRAGLGYCPHCGLLDFA